MQKTWIDAEYALRDRHITALRQAFPKDLDNGNFIERYAEVVCEYRIACFQEDKVPDIVQLGKATSWRDLEKDFRGRHFPERSHLNEIDPSERRRDRRSRKIAEQSERLMAQREMDAQRFGRAIAERMSDYVLQPQCQTAEIIDLSQAKSWAGRSSRGNGPSPGGWGR